MPARPIAQLSRADLADLNAFITIERLRSFTKAAVELGISTSALSHAMRNLEERLGVRLLNRTSRTVSPTDAGVNLARRLQLGFDEISGALDAINRQRDRPAGRLRLHAPTEGARRILARVVPAFLDAYPDMTLEIGDMSGSAFDAAIGQDGATPDDAVAIPVGPARRRVAVAAPRYLNLHDRIAIPEDLTDHRCIAMRAGSDATCRWTFEKEGERRVIEASARLCVDDTAFAIEMALAGQGVARCLEERVAGHVARGALQHVLPDWAPVEPPLTLLYPAGLPMPPGLHELVEMLAVKP